MLTPCRHLILAVPLIAVLTGTLAVASPSTAASSAPSFAPSAAAKPALVPAVGDPAGVVTRPVYVVVLPMTKRTDDDVNTVDATQAAWAIDELDAYLDEQTNGRERARLAGYEVGVPTGCRTPQQLVQRAATQHADGIFVTNKRLPDARLVVVTPEDACAGNRGGAGGGRHAMTHHGLQPSGMRTLAHEYLHALGLAHANAGYCASGRAVDSARRQFPGGACHTFEYGDTLDIQGDPRVLASVSSWQRALRGWLPAEAVQWAGGRDLEVELDDLATGTGTRVLGVVDPRSGVPYTVEYRTAEGRDAEAQWWNGGTRSTQMPDGATPVVWAGDPEVGSVRVLRPSYWPCRACDSVVVAAESALGSPAPVLRNGALVAGDSFVSGSGGFTLTVLDAAPDTGARLRLDIADPVATTVTTRLLRPRVQADRGNRLTVVVRTADGGPVLAPRYRVYAGDRLIRTATGPDDIGLPRLPAGHHRIRVQVLDGPSHLGSWSAAMPVESFRGATRVRLAARPVARGRMVRFAARLGGPLASRFDGRVALRSAGRTVAVADVRGRRGTVVVVRVPADRLRAGARVVAHYRGNDHLLPAASEPVRVPRPGGH